MYQRSPGRVNRPAGRVTVPPGARTAVFSPESFTTVGNRLAAGDPPPTGEAAGLPIPRRSACAGSWGYRMGVGRSQMRQERRSSGVEKKLGARVSTKEGGRAGGADRPREGIVYRLRLSSGRHNPAQQARFGKHRQRDRDGEPRNRFDVRETAVVYLLVPARQVDFHGLDPKRIGEIGHRRVIEREVAVFAEPETDDVNRSAPDQRLITPGFRAGVRRLPRDGVKRPDLHRVQKMFAQVTPEALRMRGVAPDVFVHMKHLGLQPCCGRADRPLEEGGEKLILGGGAADDDPAGAFFRYSNDFGVDQGGGGRAHGFAAAEEVDSEVPCESDSSEGSHEGGVRRDSNISGFGATPYLW
jgi:hypothetical protein